MGSKVSSAEQESGGIEGGQRLDAPSEEQAGIPSEKSVPEALEKESDGDVRAGTKGSEVLQFLRRAFGRSAQEGRGLSSSWNGRVPGIFPAASG